MTLTISIDSSEVARVLASDMAWRRFDALHEAFVAACAEDERRQEKGMLSALRPSTWWAWRRTDALGRKADAAMIDACHLHHSGAVG